MHGPLNAKYRILFFFFHCLKYNKCYHVNAWHGQCLYINIMGAMENKNTIYGCLTFGSVQVKQFTFINNSVRSLETLAEEKSISSSYYWIQ
jgi:hypothetical protein